MRPYILGLALVIAASSCRAAPEDAISETITSAVPSVTTDTRAASAEASTPSVATTGEPTTTTSPTTTISPFARPAWLGGRALPLRDDGFGEILATPIELQGRAFNTLDLLPPPDGSAFSATIGPIPDEVLARSTWTEDCPVTIDELRYLTISHWGFDGELHTGEMIVNAAIADDVVSVFGQLFEAAFPIEQMRVIALEELDAPPTGDFNDTTSFVCRPVVNSSGGWSQHAFGLAVDINPFHNPYEKGDLVLPELASYYLDRSLGEPGMVVEGDVVTRAFADIGWGWGGNWNTLDDFMHFSRNGH